MKKLYTLLLLIISIHFTYGKQIDEAFAKTVGQNYMMGQKHSPSFKNDLKLELSYKANAQLLSSSATEITAVAVERRSVTLTVALPCDNVKDVGENVGKR